MDYTDPEDLREMYHERGMSLPDIGRECGVDPSTVHYHMEKHDIARRKPGSERPPSMYLDGDNYEVFKIRIDGRGYTVKQHRLQAVAYFGFDKVCGNDVHHRNGIRWDNREDNFEVKSRSAHITEHNNQRIEEIRQKASEQPRAPNGNFR